MIDTIKGYKFLTNKTREDFIDILRDSKKTIWKKKYTESIQLDNFKITYSFNENNKAIKISFNGSLSKFYQGNNLFHLDWEKTRKAIKLLSNKLNVDLLSAILTRIDFGINMPLEYEVYEYINCLKAFPRLNTMRYNESVKFMTNTRSYLFYDKKAELINKNKNIDVKSIYNINNINILRYEIQLMKNIKYRFKLETVSVKDLFKKSIQKKIVDYWYNGYKKVIKQSIDVDPEYLLHKHNGLQKYLSFYGIEMIGFNRINSKISKTKFEVSNSRIKQSKLKKKIKDLLFDVEKNGLDKSLINELNTKISHIKDYILKNNSVPYFIIESD